MRLAGCGFLPWYGPSTRRFAHRGGGFLVLLFVLRCSLCSCACAPLFCLLARAAATVASVIRSLGFGTDPAPRMHQRFGTDPAPRLCIWGGVDFTCSSLVLPRSPSRNASKSEFQWCRLEALCSSTKTAKDHTHNYRRVQLGFFGFTTGARSMLMVSITFLRQRATKIKVP